MEIVAGVTLLQNTLFWKMLGGTPTNAQPVEDDRLNCLFDEMKSRMGVESSVSFCQSDACGSISAVGRLLFGGKGVVLLSSPEYFKDETDEAIKSTFAHELSHLKNQDSTRLPAFICTVQLVIEIALITLFSVEILAAYAIAFAATLTITYFVYMPIVEYQAEKAGGKALNYKELQGCIDFHLKMLEDGKEIRNKKDATCWDKFRIDSKGNLRTDWTHPNRTRLVAMLRRMQQERKLVAKATGG